MFNLNIRRYIELVGFSLRAQPTEDPGSKSMLRRVCLNMAGNWYTGYPNYLWPSMEEFGSNPVRWVISRGFKQTHMCAGNDATKVGKQELSWKWFHFQHLYTMDSGILMHVAVPSKMILKKRKNITTIENLLRKHIFPLQHAA